MSQAAIIAGVGHTAFGRLEGRNAWDLEMEAAVLAIEDRRFFSHPGLDPFRFVSAVVRNIRTDSSIPHGASTITQQLCKNFFLTPERTLRRKAQEALLAFVLERRASKEEILELYLNQIYLYVYDFSPPSSPAAVR